MRAHTLWPNTLRRHHATWLGHVGVAQPTRHVSTDPVAVALRNQLTAQHHLARGDGG